MPTVTFERKNSRLYMTISEPNTARTFMKVLGESQVAQLLDIARDLLPERELFPSADERNIVDNDEYDFLPINTDPQLYRFIVKNGPTSYDQYDFNEDDLRTFVDTLEGVRNDPDWILTEIGQALTSAVSGPTGPVGPTGPRGDIGLQGDDSVSVFVKSEDQVIDGTELATDTDLQFPVGSEDQFVFEMTAYLEADSIDPDLQVTISAPPDPTLFKAGFQILDNTGDAETKVIDAPGDLVDHVFPGTKESSIKSVLRVYGSIIAGTNPGTVGLQYSQIVGSTVPLSVVKGSYLVVRKI